MHEPARLSVMAASAASTETRLASRTVVVVLGLTLLGLVLRLWRLDAASLWADEAFSAEWIHRSIGYIWTDGLIIETTPPLYYMLLKFWAGLAGDSDWALRAFSAVASTLTIPLIFVLGLELAVPAAALAAAALFAILPMQIVYAQEARVYALVPLAFSVALLGLLRLLRASSARDRRVALWLFAGGETALIYFHATSVFTVAALTLAGFGLLLERPEGRRALPGFLLASLVVAVLSVPQLWAILEQAWRHDLEWIQPPDLVSLGTLVAQHFVDPLTPQTRFRITCLLALAAGLGLTALLPWMRLNLCRAVLLIAVPLLFLVTCVVISFFSPFLIPRITIWFGVPLALLAGMALVSPAPRWLRAGFALGLAAGIAAGMNGAYVRVLQEKEDWRGLMAELLPRLGPDDMVVVGPDTSLSPVLHYSGTAFHETGRPLYRWEPVPRYPDLYTPEHVRPPEGLDTAALAAAAARGRRVWLLLRETDWRLNAEYALASPTPPAEVDRSHAMVVLVRW